MADRFPLIVNAVSKKIEELVSGDNLDLTGNNIVIGGTNGNGKYLTSDGTAVFWGDPGDVYLTQAQTVTNKTFEQCTINGSANTITNLANNSLINSTITVNGTAIALGGSVITPDNNTTYAISAQDGATAAQKILRLTSGGNAGAGVDDDITLGVSAPSSVPAGSKALDLFIDRTGEVITVSGHVVDDNTVTTLQSATGGTAQSGDITIAAAGSSVVSQDAATKTITITSSYVDTVTRLRATTGQVFAASDFTFLDGGATTVTQGVDGNGDPTITYSSTDTITRLKGGGAGSFVTGDTTITGGANVTVSQAGNTITVASVDNDTITRLGANNGTVTAGDFQFTGAGATTVSTQTVGGVTTLTFTSANDDTGASLTASGGLILQGVNFRMKNYNNFSGNTVMKWDNGNGQLTDTLITDNGSTVTINGDLVVEGTQTILNTSTLQVEDNDIELRKGNNLTGSNGGITLNRTTDSSGNVVSYVALQWNESSGYWRSWDGSVEKRFVTENETQVLTNKTLTSPTLTAPVLGAATATSLNGLSIASTASAELDIAATKKLDVDRDLLLTSDNSSASISVNFRQGGNVAYTADTLATFASTTSTQMRGLVPDSTGTGNLVFGTNPTILTGISTTSSGFNLINSGATSILFGGAAGAITMGAATGTTTINHDLVVTKDLTVGTGISDLITFNGVLNSENADILIRGTATDPMKVGRGNSAVNTNTAVGVRTLNSVTSGSQNTGYGYETLFTTNSGASNTAYGHRCLRANGIGDNNIALGKDVLLVNTSGSRNIGIGNNTLEQNVSGNHNVCIGHYAGFDVFGDGNVLIGPAYNENSGDVTFRPPNINGDNQLVIGSGGQAWIRGDANFDVTFNNDVTVDEDLVIKGDLTVLGTQTITESNIVRVADKNIELAYVVSRQFVATAVDGTADITAINPTAGLIPGMVITTSTAGFTIPPNTTIVSITNNAATLSNNITGSGQITLTAIGPSDTTAVDGGMIVKGTTDKKITWKGTDGGVTYNTWVSSENFDLASGKIFSLNGINIADPTARVIGPTNGTGTDDVNLSGGGLAYTLGSAVLNSSLTSVGTLTALTVSGNVDIGDAPPWTVTGGNYSNLSISGSDASSAGFLWLGNGSATTNADFDLGRINYVNGSTIVAQIKGTTQTSANDDGRISFFTKETGQSIAERLRIDSGGRIAQAGKTPTNHGSPNLLLWGADSTMMIASTGSVNNSSNVGIKFAVAGGSTGDYSKAGIFVQRQDSYNDLDMIFAFRSSNDSTGVSVSDEKIRITSDGQLNLGANNNNLMGQVTIFEGTDFNTGSQLGRDNIYLISDQTSSNGGYGASIAFSRIQYSDRRAAAIVTKQTTADEDQVGLAFFTHSSTNASDNIVESLVLTHDGNLTATGNVTAFSDVTLKENIETIPNALDKVLNLRGVGFNRVDKEDNPREIGVIAQEVEEIIPEVVHTNQEGIKSVAYGNLVGLLIESIKELKAEVNDLKTKLEG